MGTQASHNKEMNSTLKKKKKTPPQKKKQNNTTPYAHKKQNQPKQNKATLKEFMCRIM